MQKFGILLITLLALSTGLNLMISSAKANEDNRELVKLPMMMQNHMLANMRDHLHALNEIFGELALGKVNKAAEIAEKRLGMSSLSLHGAKHMGQFMPETMRSIGQQMHHAASRFGVVAKNAELDSSQKAQRKVYKALQEITENCNACHQAYKIR